MKYSDLENIGTCKKCGIEFVKIKEYQIFCSTGCRKAYNNGKGTMQKTCVYCNSDYSTRLSHQLYCTQECAVSDYKLKLPTAAEWQTMREYICERDNYKCSNCNDKGIEIHHIIPLSMRGDNSYDNLELLCKKCHVLKHNEIRNKIIMEKIKNEEHRN